MRGIGRSAGLLFAAALQLSLGNGVGAQGAMIDNTGNPHVQAVAKAALDPYNTGVELMQANKPQEAADKFRESIKLAPSFPNSHCNLGTCLLLQGDPTGAVAELEKATQLGPGLAAAWATLGSTYQALGRTPEALESFKHYLSIAPNGELSPKVRSLMASLDAEYKRGGSVTKVDADDYFPEATFSGLARWPKMPITVCIKPADGVEGYRPEFADILKGAFKTWEDASQGKVSFQFMDDAKDANIVCSFTHSLSNAITEAEGGHTMLMPDAKGNIIRAEMSLLTVPLTGTTLSPGYARQVDLHEVGHSLGILGHSKNPHDIMFATVLPGSKNVELTPRDTKTMDMIYSDAAFNMAHRGIDVSRASGGDPNSKMSKMLVLNNDAKTMMDQHRYPEALAKLEEAQKLDPTNDVVRTNLGSVYGNMGTAAMMLRNFALAEQYFKKAVPLLEQGTNNMNLAPILKNYSMLLHFQKRDGEAASIDAKLAQLGGH